MMISPNCYIEQLKGRSYAELIEERDQLIRSLREFEEAKRSGDCSGTERMILPSPAMRYQMDLEYLSELCDYMSKKYREESGEG